jgi:26S proteasome non-ATPase regulatory subunit 9
MVEKDRLETELKALGQVLDSVRIPMHYEEESANHSCQHGVNMNTGLTTFDGFPRSDIDVPQSTNTSTNTLKLSLTWSQYGQRERVSYG